MRVAFVSSYLSSFFAPPLDALAERCDLHALFLDESRSSDIGYRDLGESMAASTTVRKARRVQLDRSDMSINVSVGSSRWLNQVNPDAVVVLSFVPSMWESILWAKLKSKPVVMWSESTPWSGVTRGRFSQSIRRRAIRAADAHLSNGTEATAFLREFGVAQQRIVESPFPIAPFDQPSAHPTADRPLRVLYVGRLIESKRPLDMVAAASILESTHPGTAEVRIVGDGPLANRVAQRASSSTTTEWLGRLDSGGVRDSYAWADVVVVPSEREVWGLVVNEALRSGLFVVSTNRVASVVDLVPGEACGRTYPVGDVDALALMLSELATGLDRSNEARRLRARAADEHAPAAYAPHLWAGAMLEAINAAQRS